MPTQRTAAAAMATTTEDALTVIKKAGRAKALAALSAAAAVIPGDVGGNARSIAIVQWTHTLTMKPMLLAARRQIQRHPLAEHHVVLTGCGSNSTSGACADLLARAAPLVENVTCNTPEEVAAEMPAFSSLADVFLHRGKFTKAHELTLGAWRWCWNSCDSPYLLWYARTGSKLSHVRFFWFLEWDVVWTGDIVNILTTWNELRPTYYDKEADTLSPLANITHCYGLRDSKATRGNAFQKCVDQANGPDQFSKYDSPSDHDLLCPNPSWANRNWAHVLKRDTHLVPANTTYRCVTEVFRMTHRLLRSVVAFSRHTRAAMFCEMRAASVCGMQSSWCKMRSFFDRAHMPLLYTAREALGSNRFERAVANRNVSEWAAAITLAKAKWVGTFAHDGGVPDTTLARDLSEPMLYHAYKWAPHNRSTGGAHNRSARPFGELLKREMVRQRAHAKGGAERK